MSKVKFLASLLVCLWAAQARSSAEVVINEIMANSVGLIPNGDDYPDWVELYNTGPSAVDVGGIGLTDNLSQPAKYVLPAGTRIEAGGYLLIWCDTAATSPGLHSGFSFSSAGEEVALFAPASQGGGKLDSIVFGPQPADFSLGRFPNGTGPVVLTVPTPLQTNIAAILTTSKKLSINEWMASPTSGEDWIELYNADTSPVALSGMVFSDKTTTPSTNRPLPALSFIGPGEFLQFFASSLAKNDPNHLDFKLGAKGETISLFASDHTTLVTRTKFDKQDANISQGRLPDGSDNLVFFPAGSATPAASNFRPLTTVRINEVLTHTDPPLEDAVELFNPTAAPVDISDWWLSNSPTDAKKYRIPAGTILQPGGFHVMYEYQFDPDHTGNSPSFRFNSAHGDRCFLYTGDAAGNLTGARTGVTLRASENAISEGWIETSEGPRFMPLRLRTFGVDIKPTDPAILITEFRKGKGMTNSGPKLGPLVISEIMYHPAPLVPGTDNVTDEYIEFYNTSAEVIPLFNPINVRVNPTNSYRIDGTVKFEFPLNRVLGPQGHVIVVGFNPDTEPARLAAFRQTYQVPAEVAVFGPFRGHLNNGGGVLELYWPDETQSSLHPDVGYTPLILIDRVHYKHLAPWPIEADGSGLSLQRLLLDSYADVANNWAAAAPTPGRVASPKIQSVEAVGNQVKISFTAAAGTSYGLQYSTLLQGGSWQTLPQTAPAASSTRSVTLTDTLPTGTTLRYYRLTSP